MVQRKECFVFCVQNVMDVRFVVLEVGRLVVGRDKGSPVIVDPLLTVVNFDFGAWNLFVSTYEWNGASQFVLRSKNVTAVAVRLLDKMRLAFDPDVIAFFDDAEILQGWKVVAGK